MLRCFLAVFVIFSSNVFSQTLKHIYSGNEAISTEHSALNSLRVDSPQTLTALQKTTAAEVYGFYELALNRIDSSLVADAAVQEVANIVYPLANSIQTLSISESFVRSQNLVTTTLISNCKVAIGVMDSNEALQISFERNNLETCLQQQGINAAGLEGYVFEVNLYSQSGSGNVILSNTTDAFPSIQRASALSAETASGFLSDQYHVPSVMQCDGIGRNQCDQKYILGSNGTLRVAYDISITSILIPDSQQSESRLANNESGTVDFVNGGFDNFGNGWVFEEYDAGFGNCSFFNNTPGTFINDDERIATFPAAGQPAPGAFSLSGFGSGSLNTPQREWSQLSQVLQIPNGDFEDFEVEFDYQLFTGVQASGPPNYERVHFFVIKNDITAGTISRAFTTSFLGSGTATQQNQILNTPWISDQVVSLGDNLAGRDIEVIFVTCDTESNATSDTKGLSRMDNISLSFVESPPTPDDEFEPDNTPSQFSSYTGTPQDHNFANGDTVDWVASFNGGENLRTYATSNLGVNADTCITVFNTDKNGNPTTQVGTDCDSGGAGQSELIVQQSEGSYLIEITNQNGLSGNGTEYTFSITNQPVTAQDDAFEQDDIAADFSSYSGQTQVHNFANDAVDWVGSFNFGNNRRTYSTSNLGVRADTCISVFSTQSGGSVDQLLGSDCDGGVGQSSNLVLDQPPGFYLIEITNTGNLTGFDTEYDFTITNQGLSNPSDAFEEDDNPEDFSSYTGVQQSHNFADDTVDWVASFNGGNNVRRTYETFNLDTYADTCITVYSVDANGLPDQVLGQNCSDQGAQVVLIQDSGSFLIKLENDNGVNGIGTSYTFRLTNQPL